MVEMELYPLKFGPIFKERVWGGCRLAEVFGKKLPAGRHIGESWELSDMPGEQTVIVNGPLTGQTIGQVVGRFGAEITGKRIEGAFPLLIKLLDIKESLSVQVHPDQRACERMGKGQPKSECWYIIDALPGAVMYRGLKAGTTKERFARAVADGTCAEYLEKADVRAGGSCFLPAGTCHSALGGLLIAEIQQPSDTTYRVFDWSRVDPFTGKGRALHIADALESINFGLPADKLPAVGGCIECEAFSVEALGGSVGERMALDAGAMKAIVFISGAGKICGGCGDAVRFIAGDTILIPAVFEGFIEFERDCEFLVVRI